MLIKKENIMVNKIKYIIFCIIVVTLNASCVHSRTTGPSFAAKAGIKVLKGSAIVKINGRINENLYSTSIFDTQIKDDKYYDNPIITEGTITKNETKYLETGNEYIISVLPTEVVILNIVSLDGNDVKIVVYQYGKEKEYAINGNNKLGVSIAFQNR
jgi:hypothetical protein